MSYLIAFGIGVLLGIIITCVLLSPTALEHYHMTSQVIDTNWTAMQRAREIYLSEEETESESEQEVNTYEETI